MTIIKCQKCGKEYGYEIFGGGYPGCKERETADCPYCGETGYSEMTSASIYVYKLEDISKNKEYEGANMEKEENE